MPDALTLDDMLPVSFTALFEDPVAVPLAGEAGAGVEFWAQAGMETSIAAAARIERVRTKYPPERY